METYQTLEPNVRLIYCLSIDLIESTYSGMRLSTRGLDRFNVSLVNQIKPHLESLQLTNTLLKFTGDGWLLMSEDAYSVPCLCCLGVILTKRFQEGMGISTGIYIERIPMVRAAICSGRDIQVELPNGGKDWLGDSARKATRACQICEPNQVLIDETVRCHVFRDFELVSIDVTQVLSKHPGNKWEENFPLYVLGAIKSQLAAGSDIAPYYVYTLGQLGMLREANDTAENAAKRLKELSGKLDATGKPYIQDELAIWNRLIFSLPGYASKLRMLRKMRAAKLVPDIQTYNNLMHNAPNYFSASRWLQILKARGIRPTVNTYNTLIDKAPDYDIAKGLIETMRAEGVKPDVITYNTLMNKASNYDTAKGLIEAMRADDINPSVRTYNTLMKKAPDYDTTIGCLEAMRADGINPSVRTYNTLMKKAPDYDTAKGLLQAMRAEGVEPDKFTYNTLMNKASDYDTARALIEAMRADGVETDVVTYNTLLKKVPDYDTAKGLIKAMWVEGVKPDAATHVALRKKAPDYDTANG